MEAVNRGQITVPNRVVMVRMKKATVEHLRGSAIVGELKALIYRKRMPYKIKVQKVRYYGKKRGYCAFDQVRVEHQEFKSENTWVIKNASLI